MIESSDYEQSDLTHPSGQAGFHSGSSTDGPVTVLNPEQRRRSESSSVAPSSEANRDSNLFARLFPVDSSQEPLPLSAAGEEVRLGHFRLEEPIGRGGMGAVFRAVDERLDRVVALKVLSPAFARDRATVERFRNEAKAAARLDHENIARVFYTGEDCGVPYIAFEFVTGTNLRELIRQRGRLDPEEAINYTLQIAAALRHTDAAGVVHRDIKPSNIIVAPSGRAKLVDLGLARKAYSESAPELTMAGTTLGTFDYISPEQARDPRSVDVRSDIYSLGCTLYHMLTGEPPYPEGTFFKKLLDRQDKKPPDPMLKVPGISPELAAVVQRMMAGRPRLRYRNAEELLNDLMLIAGQLGLRGIHPEGLVWASPSRLNRSGFWERHLGWMVTAAALLGIVFFVERSAREQAAVPNRPARQSPQAQGPSPAVAESPGKSPPGGKRSGLELPPNDGSKKSAAGHELANNQAQPSSFDYRRQFLRWIAALAAGARSKSLDGGSGRKAPASVGGVRTPAKPFRVLFNDGTPSKSFPTLEGACTGAKNGDVVLLEFNGLRRDESGKPAFERALTITGKSLTIRAAAGFHPVVQFAGQQFGRGKPQLRMITLSKGDIPRTLSINGVGFVIDVDPTLDSPGNLRWAAFSLQGADRIHLSGVHVTIKNPEGRPAAVFEISERAGSDTTKMKMMKNTGGEPVDRFNVDIADSFFRGECNWLSVAHARPGRIALRNCAVVVDGALATVEEGDAGEMAAATDLLELDLVHVTAITGRSTVQVDSPGGSTASVIPLRISPRNNLFAARSGQAFVNMTGSLKRDEFLNLLRWEGEKNFFDRYRAMWKMTSDDPGTPAKTMTFDDWQNHFKESNDREGGVVWKRRDWTAKTASKTALADLALDGDAAEDENPAWTGASDGSAAGADLEKVADPAVKSETQSTNSKRTPQSESPISKTRDVSIGH